MPLVKGKVINDEHVPWEIKSSGLLQYIFAAMKNARI
jgi:hypothetical protein